MPVIGIDLGTTYSAASYMLDGQTEIIMLEGFPTLPSVVGALASGKLAVGRTAKRNQARNPQDTVVEIKRLMGENIRTRLGQQEFTPQEISAQILAKIKELAEDQLGEEITSAVISCPAYFKDHQRAATKQAGELAGLNVLRIINEPTAAAYAYGLAEDDSAQSNRLAMVYDLGGGTFDVTVIRMMGGNLEVIGTGGDPQLGGGNFDDEVVSWMLEKIKAEYPNYAATLTDERAEALRNRLKFYAEEAKIALCGPPAADEYQFQIARVDTFEGKPIVFRETITMEIFENLIRDHLDRSMRWLDEAMKVPKEKYGFTESDLTDILLVGGSTRVPLVRKMLEQRYPPEKVRGLEHGINPDEIVARGAGIVAASLDPESDEIIETVLVDVTGHTLSVAALDQNEQEMLAPIIPKETPLPTKGAHEFYSQGHGQRQAKIRVFQGEGRTPTDADVKMIGEFIIDIDPIQEPTPLIIGLDLDENGLLIAHATNRLSGKQVKCGINYNDSAQLSPSEIEARRTALERAREAGVGATANPLDEERHATAQAQAGDWAAPQPPPPPPQPAAATGDPSAAMNPIIRALYQKTIANFALVPPDKQMEAMQLVADMEAAARANDQARLMALYGPLNAIMQGIG